MRLLTLILATLLAGATTHSALAINITPRPLEAELLKGSMRAAGVSIKCDPAIDAIGFGAIKRFAADLSLAGGKTCVVSAPVGLEASVENGSAKGLVFLLDNSLPDEGYRISIDHRLAVVTAASSEGFIHSLQTLRQLLPESIFSGRPAEGDKWVFPCCTITDSPRFSYRGLMLDCSRHFWTTDQIKLCLDFMERFKLNKFHWHLTDDQGWRAEIKALPLLTQIACWREGTAVSDDPNSSDHIRYGGYYSQEDMREIVEYAAGKGIEVIPEISLPGHFLAALSAYPNVGCTLGPYYPSTGWGVSDQLICAGKEESYAFLEMVLSEISSIFPDSRIHIGMSDCLTSQWEKCPDCQARIAALGFKDDSEKSAEQKLLAYFFERVRTILAENGKKAICREEVLDWTDPEDLLEDGVVIMCRSTSGRIPAATGKGIKLILTLEAEDRAAEPDAGTLRGDDPAGWQQDIWTEYISTTEQLEDCLLERLRQISGIQW